MHRWLSLAFLILLLAFPISAGAQDEITLSEVVVQLWPEFDQPSMLVICNFKLPEATPLPVDVTLRIPSDATVLAVAYQQDSGLFNAPYKDPYKQGEWQIITVTVETPSAYRIEYYAKLSRTDTLRKYVYLWPGDYAVNSFKVNLKLPVDTIEVNTDPEMQGGTDPSGLVYRDMTITNLEAGKQVPVQISYTKSSETLTASEQPVQAGAVDEDTAGRISLSNYLPYILGSFGLLLIAAGGVYFWQSGRGKSYSRRQRHTHEEPDDNEQVYCHQCGQRAQLNDRFCRTCGARLRKDG